METVLEKLYPLIPESRTTQAILIGAVVALGIYQLTKKRYKLPPGPWGYPLVGNVPAIRKTTLYRKLQEWEEDYGPVMSIMLGPMRLIVLNNYAAAYEGFVKKAADFAGRPKMYSFDIFTEGSKDIALTDYGPEWQLHRRIGLKALGYYMKGNKFQETMDEVLEMIVEEIRQEEGSGPFNIKSYLELTVFNIIGKICFDERFSKDNKEFQRFCEILDLVPKEVGNGFWEDVIPLFRWWPTKKFKRVNGLIDETLTFIYKRVNQHSATLNPEVQRDLTDALLIAQREAKADEDPEVLEDCTNTYVAQTIKDLYQAGIDTSMGTLYWTVLYVAANPEVQVKIHEELDKVMGSRRRPLTSDRHKLTYTEAVLFESMRIATATPLTLPHTTTCDTTIGEYDIPKGTMVMANIWAVHHDHRLWENPDTFRPERFLQGQKPEGWIPFSLGKRACMAKSLAEPELHLLLAGLYRNFEINLPEGETTDLSVDTAVKLGFVSKPYKVVIKYRTN